MTSDQLAPALQTSPPSAPPIPNPFDASVPAGLANFYAVVRRTLALTAPAYTTRLQVASRVSRALSTALAILIFTPDIFHADSPWIPWQTSIASTLVAIMSAMLLLAAISELAIFRPTVFRELTAHKTTIFFERLNDGYPAVRNVLNEIRKTPTDSIAIAANKVEMVILATSAALRPDSLRIVTMLRLISRILLTILLVTAFAMSLNLATGGEVVRNSFDTVAFVGTNSLDYFGFSSTFFLTTSSSFVIHASGWADVYVLLNALAMLSIGSFVIASVMSLFSSHDDLVSRAAIKLIAIECTI